MLKHLIPIFFGVLVTSLAILALPQPEVQQYVEPLGVWGFVLSLVPVALGILVSLLIPRKSKEKDVPKIAQLLIFQIGSEPISRKVLQPNKTITFGSGESDTIRVNLPSVKEKQLLIKVKNKTCVVTNMCCSYGAHLNRQSMKQDMAYNVYAGDTIQMGKIKLKFVEEE